MINSLIARLEDAPVIAAIKDQDGFERALNQGPDVIFLLKTSLHDIRFYIDKAKAAGKLMFIHFDLIEGLSRDQAGLKYLLDTYQPDGIISTKAPVIKYAKEQGVLTIQRFFLLDSLNLETTIKAVKYVKPDAIEILPGAMPKVTRLVVEKTRIPVITGGLIMDKEDVYGSLSAGASGISTSKQSIWDM